MNGGCVTEESFQHPQIIKDENGMIFAQYGAVRYELDQSKYKDCQVVGYDGIGCHAS